MLSNSRPAKASALRGATAWQRVLVWLRAFEKAMDTSYDEIQDRRLFALETEVATLRKALIAAGLAQQLKT